MELFQKSEQQLFDNAIRALEAEVASIGTHLAIDANARQAYARQIQAMSSELKVMAQTGRITWQ